jgi:alkylated DNA repair dioxygenase AlkB
VNHAAVSIGDYIYSFGGYCSGEDYRLTRPMDVHMLNTNNLRWSLLPTTKEKYPAVPFQRYGELLIGFDAGRNYALN